MPKEGKMELFRFIEKSPQAGQVIRLYSSNGEIVTCSESCYKTLFLVLENQVFYCIGGCKSARNFTQEELEKMSWSVLET
jgi:hypothetical protein